MVVMQQFTIRENGKMSDSAVLASIEDLRVDVPSIDETAVEAHMMIFRTYAAYFTAISSRYEDLGLSHARFNMLRWLHHAETHRLTMSELGAHLEASVPNVIRMVQALEADGWVRRVPSESDKRVMFVELTAEGHERFRALLPRAVALWEEVQAGLSKEEQSVLSHLLAKLRMSLFSRYLGHDLVAYRLAAKGKRGAKGEDRSTHGASLQLSQSK
jgi:MarR family 2-MHQ and catechol resistance regulon transcriptional repressor